ncbi:MAG: radical SAM protein [Verrucomicrobia bacterium]|nr:radical SAM protein [Verrucomicrobiota bacterium]MBU1735940.1 radical SAM protein [Verrucomicrobiota bacterium]MBU1855604.1 radical SAM protein [Verrucomicrobiota bacterium]
MPDFKYLFGPVPSRRFGLSLGVDLLPRKTCTLDCIFCEVGPTTHRTLVRKEYVPTEEVLKELAAWFALNLKADFITVTGSGEPTLHTRFGDVLSAIRAQGRVSSHELVSSQGRGRPHAGVRAALLTNSTLLHLPEVRSCAALAEVVKVSLSAWDQVSFAAITRPHADLSFDRLVDGLRKFRQDFSGELWMEVFIVPGLNALRNQVKAIAALARTIRPDRVQLNTAVRPTAQQDVPPLSESQLRSLAGCFTPAAEVIARFASGGVPIRDSPRRSALAVAKRYGGARSAEPGARSGSRHADKSAVRAMLQRRPCTVEDVAHAFALSREEAETMVRELVGQHVVRAEVRNGETYYIGE